MSVTNPFAGSVRPYSLLTSIQETGSPVLTKEQATKVAEKLLAWGKGDTLIVVLTHTARSVTRVANGKVLLSDDGDTVDLAIYTSFGRRGGASMHYNQIDDASLKALLDRAETMARVKVGSDELLSDPIPENFEWPETKLWHDTTVQAMTEARRTTIPQLVEPANAVKMIGAGFLGLMARSRIIMHKHGWSVFTRETDTECTVSVRTPDGKSSGWSGQADRDWGKVKPSEIAAKAVDFAVKGQNVRALEPGRRTAILTPTAVGQLLRSLCPGFDAGATDMGMTPFSKPGGGNKLGEQVVDGRLNLRSDPGDPVAGYAPYFGAYSWPSSISGIPSRAMKWIENGTLTNLSYDVGYGLASGKEYTITPYAIQMDGGPTTIDQMIASCQEGIYVNRFSDLRLLDLKTSMTTGFTRDGCFLIKNGKIDRPVKNFQILDSPFFAMNSVLAIGPAERVAFGYMPGAGEWPLPPMVVPSLMVRDFNFSALIDAV